MAKRKKTTSEAREPSAKLRKHMEALGLKSVSDYHAWCVDHGFAPSIDKGHQDLQEEAQTFQGEQKRARSQETLHRNPRRFIQQACAGGIDPEDVKRPKLQEFAQSIHDSKADGDSRNALCALLLAVNDRADFAMESVTFGSHTYRYVDALIRLNDRRGQWIRPLDTWQPSTHNRDRQFSSLARHLFARYPVPTFMDSAWFRGGQGAYHLRNWFIHIGSGKNIRTAKTPVPMTKRIAHHFAEAPDHYSIENAIRWGQIHALEGDRRLTEAILGTPLGESFEHEAFWTTVFRFFVANPLLDRKHVGPIVDYLRHQKFETREVVTGPGTVELQEPPQPNLSMRGRTAESLLRQVDQWHQELGRTKVAQDLYFKRSGVPSFAARSGPEQKNTWRIRELLSGAELVAEGRAMRHCVASYAASCARGHCSIWAMELETPTGTEKHQTVEVNAHGTIVESRGRFNRLPTAGEYEILKRWAREAGLTLSHYVFTSD